MATVKYAISTSNKAGYAATYSTLSAWIAAMQTAYPDLASANVQLVAECFNDWVAGLPDTINVTGFNTDATHDITIQAAAGQSHNGNDITTGFFIQGQHVTDVVAIKNNYVLLKGIGVSIRSNYSGARQGITVFSGGAGRTVDCCIVENTLGFNNLLGSIATKYPGSGGFAHSDIKIRNCKVDAKNSGDGISADVQATVLNCTVINAGGTGLTETNNSSRSMICKNTVAYGNATNFALSGYTGTANNAASDGATNTPPGANPLAVNITSADFTDTANNDFSIPAGSQLINAGADLSVSDNFTNDILGNTRG